MGKKLLTGLCQILLVIALVIFVFLLRFKSTFLAPQFYKSSLSSVDFYTKEAKILPDLLADAVSRTSEGADTGQARSVIMDAASKQLTPLWLQSNVENVIDQTIGYVNGSLPAMKIMVDLSSFMPSIGASVNESAMSGVNALRACTPEEESVLFTGGGQTALDCLPSFMNVANINAALGSQANGGSANLWQYDLGAVLSKDKQLNLLRDRYTTLNRVLFGLPIFIGLMAVFIILLNLHSLKKILKSLALPVLIVAIVELALVFAFKAFIPDMISGLTSSIPNGNAAILSSLAVIAVDAFSNYFIRVFGIIAIGSGVLLVIALFLSKGEETPPAKPLKNKVPL